MLVLQVIVFLWCSFGTEICANIGQGNVVWLTGKVREFCFGRPIGTLYFVPMVLLRTYSLTLQAIIIAQVWPVGWGHKTLKPKHMSALPHTHIFSAFGYTKCTHTHIWHLSVNNWKCNKKSTPRWQITNFMMSNIQVSAQHYRLRGIELLQVVPEVDIPLLCTVVQTWQATARVWNI